MIVLRTTLPFWKSRPSMLLGTSTFALLIIVVGLPFIALGSTVELVPLSFTLISAIFGVICSYIVANEVAKKWYYRRITR
jgi:Mg2+-importing ATPase